MIDPESIFETRETAAAYLAGLIDGEGCVYYRARPGIGDSRALTIVNTETSILHACQKIYESLGIYYTVGSLRYPSRQEAKRAWRIRVVRQQGFLDVYKEIPIQSLNKQTKLLSVLRSYVHKPLGRLPARTAIALNVTKNKRTAAAYLAAIIDGEGSICRSRNRITIANTDDAILATAQRCYDKLGIVEYRLYNKGTSSIGNFEVKTLVISKKHLLHRVYQHVPIQCTYKQALLREKFT